MKEWLGVAVGCAVTFLVGLVSSPFFHDFLLRRCRRISWRRFMKSLRHPHVLKALHRAGPDLIICLNDGIVPGAILARNLQINDVVYCRVENPGKDDQFIHGLENVEIMNRRVLLIDDQILSGENMKAAYGAIKNLPNAESARISRMAVFQYDSPPTPHSLEIPSVSKTKGKIKIEPWSFSDYHRSRAVRG